MFRRLRLAIVALAVCVLPVQAVASVVMPLCHGAGMMAAGGDAEHGSHGAAHAGERHAAHAGADHGGTGHAGDHGQPAEPAAGDATALGVCHLTAGLALGSGLEIPRLDPGLRFDAFVPARIASFVPEGLLRPPLR